MHQVQCGGPTYQVQLGRRDGMVSQASMASILPGPNVDIPTAIDLFSKKGLNSFDMAILIGTPPPTLRCHFLNPMPEKISKKPLLVLITSHL